MAKRKRKTAQPQIRPETWAAEALTVLWMISAMTTLVCEIGLLAARWYLASHADAQQVAALYFLLWLTAVIVGTLTLALVPIVLKMRMQPPPPGVTIAAVVIGAVPWVIMLVS